MLAITANILYVLCLTLLATSSDLNEGARIICVVGDWE
jgi:hypothetical protein